MSATLVAHRGASEISRSQLDLVQPPAATATWFPIRHSDFYQLCLDMLQAQGFEVRNQKLALTKDGHRFFATLDLAARLADGVNLAVGLRNSTDKSLPMGWCCGSRVFVCDNLAFSAEQVVMRKHTRFGQLRFSGAVENAVKVLPQFQAEETARIETLKSTALNPVQAESYMIRAAEKGIVAFPRLPDVLKEYREPSFDAFKAPTQWSLYNAFTHVLGPMSRSNPVEFTRRTIRLMSLFMGQKELANAA